jgi:tripartite-type tricarboxylate transporter receptor subunit TctC
VLAVHPSVQAATLKEFVALAKAKPGGINYASGGVGTIGHLSAALLEHTAGIRMQHIVYKGSGQAVIDLLGGHVGAMFSGMSSVLPHAKAGKLRLLAVTGTQRSPAVPDLPTVAESGYAGYEAVGWFGLIAPAGTPKPLVDRLNRETLAVLRSPDVSERLTTVGFDIVTSRPDEFAAYIRAEVAKWNKLVKQIGIKAG